MNTENKHQRDREVQQQTGSIETILFTRCEGSMVKLLVLNPDILSSYPGSYFQKSERQDRSVGLLNGKGSSLSKYLIICMPTQL